MAQTNKSSEAQSKLIDFLREEFDRLKSEHQNEFHKKIFRRKIDKKRKKLYQKVEAILSINPLDTEIKEELLALLQEITDLT